MHFIKQSSFDWTSFTAVVVAIVALCITGYQAWLMRFSNSAELLLRFDDKFNSDDFRDTRIAACRFLLDNRQSDKRYLEDVLDFFETVGLMVKRGGLDKEMVWHTFFYWVHGYFKFSKSFIDEQTKSFPNRYNEFIFLNDTLLGIEKKHKQINEEEWKDFLNDEL